MSRRKVSPEAQIIALFTGLSDEGKRMVMFGLNAIMSTESPKSPTPSAEKKSSRRSAAQGSTPSIAGEKENASIASSEPKELCIVCGNPAEHSDHDATYLSSHVFEVPKSKKKAAA